MGVLKHIWGVIDNISLILRSETPFSKKELVLTYLRLKLKSLLLIRILKLNVSNEKIFKFKLSFFNYRLFVCLFEEIFINQQYYFNTNNSRPFIVDCGSNIGMSLIFFKKLYPYSKIISFEPDKKNFKILKRNIKINKLNGIELFNKALNNSEETTNFYYNFHLPGLGITFRKKKGFIKSYEKVDSVKLSNYIKGEVDFLKIDIEGAEDLVIEELVNQKKLKFVKKIVIEYHHYIEPKYDQLSKILKILEEEGFGYQISTILKNPFPKEEFQDILIYAYNK